MAKSDFYPATEGAQQVFLDNLVVQIGPVGELLGLSEADQQALITACADRRAARLDKTSKRLAAQAATTHSNALDRSTEELVRQQVRRLKAHPNYTVAMGLRLGVEGPDVASHPSHASAPLGGLRPTLEAIGVLNGAVELSFMKNGFSGVEIECQRGTETVFSFLARDTDAPYIDTRANLTDGPETRRYRARYLQKDTLTAEYSDVLVVTVPGRA